MERLKELGFWTDLTSLLRDILMLLTTLFPTSKFVPFHSFLVVMIAVKETKSVSFLKLEPFISTGLTNDFLLFDHISLHSFYFCLARADKSFDFSPFTPLFMLIHLPLIHFAPPPRLLIDFKNSNWLTYFCILLCICYCFSHLIGLLFVTWLSLI